MEINKIFTNREIAIGIWIIIFIIYCATKKDIRKATINCIKCIFSKKLCFLYIFIYGYLAVVLYILYKIGFWKMTLMKDTIIWLITVPIMSIMKANDDGKGYFKETLKSCFEIYILIEFLGLNYPFSIIIELVIIPIILLFSLVGEFAEKLGGTKEVSIFSYIIVIVISGFAFVHSIKMAICDYQNLISFETIRNIIYVPILTLVYMPITYIIVVFMKYQDIFLKIELRKYLSREQKKIIKLEIIKKYKMNLDKIKKIKIEEFINNIIN